MAKSHHRGAKPSRRRDLLGNMCGVVDYGSPGNLSINRHLGVQFKRLQIKIRLKKETGERKLKKIKQNGGNSK